MATVTINGEELTTDDPKLVRRALEKARREEKKAAEVERIDRDNAHIKAQANGYRLLSWKLEGNGFPPTIEFHPLGSAYCKRTDSSVIDWDTEVMGYPKNVTIGHYGQQFVGVVSGASYPFALFLRNEDGTILCYALGTSNDSYSLAPCLGIAPSDFMYATCLA